MRSDDTVLPKLLYFGGAVERDPEIDRWLGQQPADLARIGRTWFAVLRRSGSNVRELIGEPACSDGADRARVSRHRSQGDEVSMRQYRSVRGERPDPSLERRVKAR